MDVHVTELERRLARLAALLDKLLAELENAEGYMSEERRYGKQIQDSATALRRELKDEVSRWKA